MRISHSETKKKLRRLLHNARWLYSMLSRRYYSRRVRPTDRRETGDVGKTLLCQARYI